MRSIFQDLHDLKESISQDTYNKLVTLLKQHFINDAFLEAIDTKPQPRIGLDWPSVRVYGEINDVYFENIWRNIKIILELCYADMNDTADLSGTN